MRFAVVIEEGDNNLSAWAPDLPGCVATGHSREEVERNMREAIEMHLEGMVEDGEPVPEPRAELLGRCALCFLPDLPSALQARGETA